MITHELQQGTEEWSQFRLDHFGSSEAAAMLGLSSKVKRNELLLMKKTGIAKEFSDWVQKNILNYGHEVEANARPLVEQMLGEELYPVTCSDGRISASCDGLTMLEDIAFEHKQWNEELAASVTNGILPEEYMPQCQQILMVTGAVKVIFVVSDGSPEKFVHMDVLPDAGWFEKLRAGWAQFEKDLADFAPREIAEKPEPAAIMQLPALSIQIKGEVTVSNLPEFKQAAETFISSIKTDLATDDDFANAEATVKFCDETEKKLESAKSAAIGQTASIDELMRTIDFIKESIRTKRLTLEKLVKTQKENIKTKIIDDAYKLCAQHQSSIAAEFPRINFPALANLSRQSFETACKNKRTLASLHNAVDTEVASIKIKLDDLARVIRKNISHLPEDLSLFRDLQSIVTKPEDDFKLLVESRLAEQKRKEEEAAQRAIAEAKAREEAEAKRIAAAQEEAARRKEEEAARIASLPADVKSILADEEKQAESIVKQINKEIKKFSVTLQSFDDLSEQEQDDAYNNGSGKEYASYIRVKHNGATILLKNDAAEPEDATFSRDFNWIMQAIRQAYELGFNDGKQSLKQESAA